MLFAVNIPSLLALGFGLAAVLMIMGYREKQLPERANGFFRAGLMLLGVMIALTPILWYWTGALFSGSVQMSISDILVLGMGTALGGFFMGVGLLFRLRKQ